MQSYNLPEDRTGDIICMSSEFMTIGSSKDKHDLSGLNEPLRSHGGLHEREVPFIINKKMSQIDSNKQLYNYDAFYYAYNGSIRKLMNNKIRHESMRIAGKKVDTEKTIRSRISLYR